LLDRTNQQNPTETQTATLEREEGFGSILGGARHHEIQSYKEPGQKALDAATLALLGAQAEDGHWRYDLEADVTIPSEYVMLQRFFGRSDRDRERRIGNYLKRRQQKNGSWSLYHGGPGDISATVKAYFCMKLLGRSKDELPMVKARQWIRANGGAESVNVFTRITLAIFGQLPWRVVPAMPVEIMFLPSWWFFSLNKVSYWSRCVIVPLLVIFAKKPTIKLSEKEGIEELFLSDPARLRNLDGFRKDSIVKNFFIGLDRVLKLVDPLVPRFVRDRALRLAERWMREHTKGPGGIGAIYPAIANAAMALRLLGAEDDDPDFVRQMKAIEDLVLDEEKETYCQPCVSPIWDTCLSLSALSEGGAPNDHPAVQSAVEWLFDNQIFVGGDWQENTKGLDPGGWAFQYENDKYPDVDDTGMVLMALLRAGAHEKTAKKKRLHQALNWVLGMQNPDGSWGAFDVGNNCSYLNNIPFADHGALVDPGTADLTARCIELLAMIGHKKESPAIQRAMEFLKNDQEEDGSWYGRWGVNYIYGTWSVLAALGVVGEDMAKPYVRKAVRWLEDHQNSDGGWGESCNSYDDSDLNGCGVSTASQTAWAMLGLMASGEYSSKSVERGADYLTRTQNAHGEWDEEEYTGTGFPKVFYLRYHGYSKYFPVWALAVYRRNRCGLKTRQEEIMDEGPIDLGPLKFANLTA
tara:strand:+ start:3845 stop:5923 length:2079 start_codon:yes stop_codon:yes gene_type:complete